MKGPPSFPFLPQPSGTCVPGSGLVPGRQDFLQVPLDILFFKEFRYLLLMVLGPDSRTSSTSGFSHGSAGGGGLHPGC